MLTINKLQKISKMNLASLCREAGLKVNTIRAKVLDGRELKVDESEKLRQAIEHFGLTIKE